MNNMNNVNNMNNMNNVNNVNNMNNIPKALKIQTIENCEEVNLQDYQYAFITMMSEVILQPVSQISQIDWDEVLDMRLFDNRKEAHVWKDDILQGVIVEETAETTETAVTTKAVEAVEAVETAETTETTETTETAETAETTETDHIDQIIIVMKNISDKKLKVRKYLSYDEDGQAYVALTRMVELV